MMHKIFFKLLFWISVVIGTSFLTAAPVCAEFKVGPDLEKPKPVFTREGEVVAAKLIPRAKSTSVVIYFKVSGGTLSDVKGIDFFVADRPEVNVKNFKSALFEVNVANVPVGGEARISIFSEFFTSATQYFVFNETLAKPWSDSNTRNISLPNRVQELIIPVKDGGLFDADGAENGKIKFVGGPRDSFWGYALGTLFIRFFGIFLVLSVLMIGMIVSGRIFHWFESRKSLVPGKSEPQNSHPLTFSPEGGDTLDISPEENTLSPQKAAAIGVALHLHRISLNKTLYRVTESRSASDSWPQSGRSQLMTDRLMIFNRPQAKDFR